MLTLMLGYFQVQWGSKGTTEEGAKLERAKVSDIIIIIAFRSNFHIINSSRVDNRGEGGYKYVYGGGNITNCTEAVINVNVVHGRNQCL